jgi:hypothetical protein
MFIPSTLPQFEIPTGLMPTGLRGLRGFGHGLGALGQIDVGPLGQAIFSGQIQPSWDPTPMVLSGPDPNPQPLPAWLYPSQSFTQQLASLLGGTAVQAPPAYDFGTITYQGQVTNTLPPAWQVSVGGVLIMPGAIFQPGTILQFDSECAVENMLVQVISDAQLSSACASGGTGTTPTQLAIQQGATAPVTPSGQPTIVGYTPPAATNNPVTTTPIVAQPTQPVAVSLPTTTPAQTVPSAAPTCSTIGTPIQQLQSAGYSNPVIWQMIAIQYPALLTCPAVIALQPANYSAPPASQQPGAVTQPSGSGSGNGSSSSSSSSGPSTNTILIVAAIAIGALLLIGGRE